MKIEKWAVKIDEITERQIKYCFYIVVVWFYIINFFERNLNIFFVFGFFV